MRRAPNRMYHAIFLCVVMAHLALEQMVLGLVVLRSVENQYHLSTEYIFALLAAQNA